MLVRARVASSQAMAELIAARVEPEVFARFPDYVAVVLVPVGGEDRDQLAGALR